MAFPPFERALGGEHGQPARQLQHIDRRRGRRRSPLMLSIVSTGTDGATSAWCGGPDGRRADTTRPTHTPRPTNAPRPTNTPVVNTPTPTMAAYALYQTD